MNRNLPDDMQKYMLQRANIGKTKDGKTLSHFNKAALSSTKVAHVMHDSAVLFPQLLS